VRTTYAMVAACVIRRRQVMRIAAKDPFGVELAGTGSVINTPPESGFVTPSPSGGSALASTGGTDTPTTTHFKILQSLEQASAQQDLSKSLARTMYLLQQCEYLVNFLSACPSPY
jgi:hypothetical protein